MAGTCAAMVPQLALTVLGMSAALDLAGRGFGLLQRFGLSFDLQLYPAQMHDAAALAHAYPDVQIILDHAGMPVDRDERGLDLWITADNVRKGAATNAIQIAEILAREYL